MDDELATKKLPQMKYYVKKAPVSGSIILLIILIIHSCGNGESNEIEKLDPAFKVEVG